MKEELIAQQIQEIAQAVQGAQQAAQEAKQAAQSISQVVSEAKQSIQGSQQEKSSMTESKQEEILGGEGIRAATISGARLWNFNEKLLAAKELEYDLSLKALQIKDKEIEIARKQHDFAHAQKLDQQNLSTKMFLDTVQVASAQNGQNFDHAVKFDYAKFNNAVSEPIAPNTKDDGSLEE